MLFLLLFPLYLGHYTIIFFQANVLNIVFLSFECLTLTNPFIFPLHDKSLRKHETQVNQLYSKSQKTQELKVKINKQIKEYI